jgi:hypothetical protein
MNKKTESKLPEKIGSKLLASIVGLTDRRLYQLAEVGEIPKPENGEFLFRETLLALFRYSRRDSEKLRSEKLGLLTAKREREQLWFGHEAGELVYARQVQALWDAAIIELRNSILATEIPEATKRKILSDLREIPLAEYQGDKATDGEKE